VRRALVALLLLLVGGLLAGCGTDSSSAQQGPVADVSMRDSDNLHGAVLPTPYDVPGVRLQDTSGAPYSLASDARRPLTLVFFGYTHCPDICQVVMADLASAMVRLDPDRRSQVDVVFVTTDPARDTGAVLRDYLSRFDPGFEGVTGSLPAVVRAGKAFDIPVAKGQKLPSGGYDVQHGTQVVGVLPDGSAPYVWTEGTSAAHLADDVTTILDGEVATR
jgi:protein SCO1/2